MVRNAEEHRASKTPTGLGWLVGARLLLAGLSLGLAVVLDRLDGAHGDPAIWGVYWTVIVAFAATIISAVMVQRTQNPRRFATVQVGIDVAIVTSLVYFSGAGESVFTFLYALVVLYGALVLDRGGVGVTAGLASVGFGIVLFGAEFGLLPSLGTDSAGQPLFVLGAYWGFYTGALLVLGMLANTLAAELRRTGAALDRRTHDLRVLRDLHLRTVESIGSGLLTTDDEWRVTSFNPEAERITGVCAGDANGAALDELIPGAETLIREAGDGSAGDASSPRRDRIPFRSQQGEDLHLGLGASSLRDESGRALGQVVIFQDVSKVVSMEEELRRSERLAAVGEMAARMAHEIRNPLASISGSVQILQTTRVVPEGESGEQQTRLMDIVVREVDRLNDLIGDFLRYSRPVPLNLESVDLAEVIEQVTKMGASQQRSDIVLTVEVESGIRVLADPAQITAVVWNLWNNAMESMGDSGRLEICVSRIPADDTQGLRTPGRNEDGVNPATQGASVGRIRLEVQDNGPGIPPEVLEMIFEPFFTTKQDGTGLGLATVGRIIEQHGGVISVTSDPSHGTCFRIELDEVEANS